MIAGAQKERTHMKMAKTKGCNNSEFRVITSAKGGKLRRMQFKERSTNGKFVPIDRPWSEQDAANMLICAKGLTRAAKEARPRLDVNELIKKVNHPRRKRSNLQQKPAAPSVDDGEATWGE
jgi:hypothetical protein